MSKETVSQKEGLPYIGKIGEYRVLTALLERGIDVYPAIRSNQQDYDITAILQLDRVVRIQVKTTELNNKSTNNAISGTDKQYDFLVLVVVISMRDHGDDFSARFLVLAHDEVAVLRGQNTLLSVSYKTDGE